MSEKKFRRRIVEALRPLCAFAVENSVNDGAPDICTTAGWIELKVADRPVRAETVVRVDMRASQRVWHRRWREHGGRSWTLTELSSNGPTALLLHDGLWASAFLGQVDQLALGDSALAIWGEGFRGQQLIEKLMSELRRTR